MAKKSAVPNANALSKKNKAKLQSNSRSAVAQKNVGTNKEIARANQMGGLQITKSTPIKRGK